MKVLSLLPFMALILLNACTTTVQEETPVEDDPSNNEAQVITKLIQYDVPIKEDTEGQYIWFDEIADADGFQNWLSEVITLAKAGELQAYDYGTKELLKPEDLKRIMYPEPDTFSEIDPVSGIETVTIKQTGGPSLNTIEAIRFQEQWTWHAEKGLKKEVLNIALLDAFYDNNDIYRGSKLLFWIKTDGNGASDGLPAFDDELKTEVNIFTGVTNHFWYKENIDPSGRLTWLDSIFNPIKRGEDSVSKSIDGPIVSGEDVFKKNTPDTIRIIDPITLEETVNIEYHSIGSDVIHHIQFIENWSYHPEKGFTKTVLKYAPMYESNKNDKNNTTYQPIFWVKNE